MTTILGSHISIIRPCAPRRSIVYNNERPHARYRIRPTTICAGKVRYVSVKTLGGCVWSLTAGTHVDVINTFNLDPGQVIATGWMLEDNTWIWR